MMLARSLRLPRPRFAARPVARKSRRCAAGRALLAGVAFQIALWSAGVALTDRYRLDAVDREYAQKLSRLRDFQKVVPDADLFVVLGSSRMVMAFHPELLPGLETGSGRRVVPFNFAHFGAGPVMTRVVAGRFPADGVRPRFALVELMPGFFPRENTRLIASVATAGDVARHGGYFRTLELPWEFLRCRVGNGAAYLQKATRPVEPIVSHSTLGGYTMLREEISPADRAAEVASQSAHFGFRVRDWKPSERSLRAVRDAVADLRGQGCEVRLLLSPETDEHSRMYGPDGRERVTAAMTALAKELDAPLIDARDWLLPEDLTDGHHALMRGAVKFTERLRTEVMEPWLAGR